MRLLSKKEYTTNISDKCLDRNSAKVKVNKSVHRKDQNLMARSRVDDPSLGGGPRLFSCFSSNITNK